MKAAAIQTAWASVADRGHRLIQVAADFLYPPLCRLCAVELPDLTVEPPPAPFCEACTTALAATHGAACRRCGARIGPGLDPALPCGECRDERFVFERVIRLGEYDDALREAVLQAKSAGGESLAAALAELTWSVQREALAHAGIDVVVPVPRFWAQRLVRRHHAAETLAHTWGRRLKAPVATHILRKVRWTPPQTKLLPTERRRNLRGAFAVATPGVFSGATVLLADDVLTTGATAQEAARQLLHAGASRVVVAVVARTPSRR